jgi:hypothetical protein
MATQTSTKRQATAGNATATRKRNAAKQSAARTKASIARQAERVALIPVGAALAVRDAVIDTARTYSDPRRAKRQLDRFERRGATSLRRNRRTLMHKARVARRDVAQRTDGVRSNAENLVEEVRSII